jgi:dephospho-CoA kinase
VKRVALTGGIATGKSVVRAEFERLGVPTVDADLIAREAVAPGTPALAAILARFGSEILDEHHVLDRRKLGAIVFADTASRRDLERIVHPAVQAAINTWLVAAERDGHRLAIAVIPLLYETGRERDFDLVITTACADDEQLRRVIARDGLTEPQARQRIAAQLSTEEKVRRANYAIWTDGAIESTKKQVLETLERLARPA